MADDRYNRWQGLAIAQLSIAVALISGLSVAGIGVGFSLLQNKEFLLAVQFKYVFAASLLLLLIAALLSCGAVITRLLDFRLTARKVRKATKQTYDKPLNIFGLGPDCYGRATWGLFWASCLMFVVGMVLLVLSVGVTFADRLVEKAVTGSQRTCTKISQITLSFSIALDVLNTPSAYAPNAIGSSSLGTT